MTEDGANLIRLTSGPSDEFGYDVSPDGTKMAYNSNASGTQQVYIMDLTTTVSQQITFTGQNMFPRWNQNGSKLLVSRAQNAGSNDDLVTMNPDGSGLVSLTTSAEHETQGEWSPDGTRIVFTKGFQNGGMNLWVMNANGTGQTQITNMSWDEYQPTWNPAGTQIAFHGLQNDWDIMRVDATGAGLVNLTNSGGPDQGPGWTPEGQILFTSQRLSDSIFRMNADGTNVALVRQGFFTAPRFEMAVPEPATVSVIFGGLAFLVRRTKRSLRE